MSENQSAKKFEELRRRAETLVASTKSSDANLDLTFSFDELIHELEVYQIELEMQHGELEQAYHRLETSRREFMDLFDFAPVGYLITDDSGLVLNANLTVTAMFGLNRMDIEGQSFASFVDKNYKDAYYLHRQSVFNSEKNQSCELHLHLPNDHSFFVRMDSAIISGQKQCRVALTDITQQKQAESIVRATLQRERELNELKNRLLEMISHEFNTPLTVILTSVDMLEKYDDQLDSAKKTKRFQTIRDFVWQLSRLTAEITRAYRNEVEDVAIHPEDLNCLQILQDVCDNMQTTYRRDIELITPETIKTNNNIVFDEMILRQILINLLHNSIKYSDEPIEVMLQMDRRHFVITISDHGIGIPTEDQTHIFETFFRGSNAENITGTGIGLSLVQRFVHICNGQIEVKSALNEGTRFILTFPRKLAAE